MSIILEDIRLTYASRTVIDRLSITLEPGRVHVLIGPNGSGKSTLLRAMAGLSRPAAGSARLMGRDLHRWPRRDLARHLAFLPQAPGLPEDFTVEQLADQGRFAHRGLLRGPGPEDREAVSWALDRTGMSAHRNSPLARLSGGERQRAWIAAALAQQTGILLLDEPTAYLDLGHQLEVLELLTDLSQNNGLTVAMSLHEINHALMFGDRISLLQEGALIFTGDAAALSRTDHIHEVFRVEGYFRQAPGSPILHIPTRAAPRREADCLKTAI